MPPELDRARGPASIMEEVLSLSLSLSLYIYIYIYICIHIYISD